MPIIYYLQHRMHHGPFWNDKAIGAYQSGSAAVEAIARAKLLPGFDRPEGAFTIYPCVVDRDYWPGGIDRNVAGLSAADAARAGAVSKLSSVYFLSNVSDVDVEAPEYIIGFYSSKQAAEQAMERLSKHPQLGVEGREFIADRYVVGQDHWRSGFNTLYEGLD